jgi:hypothetical protein
MVLWLLVALALVTATAPASAVEYRLQVASVLDDAFRSFMKPGEAADGATGPGLERLAASLDAGDFPKAVLLYDRHLQAASESTARAYGGVPVRADVKKGGEQTQRWDEVRWDGMPGEQSVWLVVPRARRTGELHRVALRGTGPIRHWVPYSVSNGRTKLPVASFPFNFLWSREEDADFWTRRVAPVLDLGAGIAVIVGANAGFLDADQAYVVVTHGREPVTYKAVFGWRDRHQDRESPGDGFFRINRRW